MNAQAVLRTYKLIAILGLERWKCGQLLSLDRDPCVLGKTETWAKHYLILMGLSICSSVFLCIYNHENRIGITLIFLSSESLLFLF